ncbi:MAG: hypothetical protein Tsb0024_06430 [Ruegeria sp.]
MYVHVSGFGQRIDDRDGAIPVLLDDDDCQFPAHAVPIVHIWDRPQRDRADRSRPTKASLIFWASEAFLRKNCASFQPKPGNHPVGGCNAFI